VFDFHDFKAMLVTSPATDAEAWQGGEVGLANALGNYEGNRRYYRLTENNGSDIIANEDDHSHSSRGQRA
jgi:hypothetical protein